MKLDFQKPRLQVLENVLCSDKKKKKKMRGIQLCDQKFAI